MTAPLGSLIDHGVDILSTSIDKATNRILAFLGDVKAKVAESDRAKWVQHVGFASRPGKPIAGKSAAQATVIRRSDGDVVVGSSDARTLEMYGQLGDGETALFAGGPDGTSQGRILIKGDGSVNAYTRAGNASGGAGMVLQLDAANNAVRMLNGLGYGIIADATGITITVGKASLKLDAASGDIHLTATGQLQIDGTAIVLGASPIPPIPGVQSALLGATGIAGLPSTKVFIPQ